MIQLFKSFFLEFTFKKPEIIQYKKIIDNVIINYLFLFTSKIYCKKKSNSEKKKIFH